MAGNFWKSSHYEQWILDKQDLYRQRGEDLKFIGGEDDYNRAMILFINYIQHIGNYLQSRQQMIATASVYFRRFYATRSLRDIDPFLLAISCLHLAAKVEEHGNTSPSKLSSAVNNLAKTYPWAPSDDGRMTKLITEVEFYLLEVMDCCLIVYHPYRTALQLFSDMKANDPESKLKNIAWGMMNDSLKTDACLLFPPHQIAIACLVGATVLLKRNREMGPWFQELSVDYDAVFEILRMILAAYKRARSVDFVNGKTNPEYIKNLLSKLPKPQSGSQSSNQNMLQQGLNFR